MPICSGCGNPIIWIKSKGGKNIPCDPLMLIIVTNDGEIVRGRESHFSTCPKANDFRKKEKT